MNKLHPGAKWLFRVRAYASFIFFAFFFGVWIFSASIVAVTMTGNFTFLLLPIILGIVLFFGISEIYAQLAYKFWKYELTPHELKIEKGIIFKVYKSIPYSRVQNVDIHRGILARMIGFSTLNIQTAGYSAVSGRGGMGAMSEGYIPAVSMRKAEEIRDFLMKKIGKKQGI